MDINPIQEKKTWQEIVTEKFKEFGNKFKKPKVPHLNKQIKQLNNNQILAYNKIKEFGTSCEKAGKALVEFNKFMTPNQMRKALELDEIPSDETILYSDGEPYCILNKKGDIVWQKK